MTGYTSANDPKRVEEGRVPDPSVLSLGRPQVLFDTVSRVVDLLEFRLRRGC